MLKIGMGVKIKELLMLGTMYKVLTLQLLLENLPLLYTGEYSVIGSNFVMVHII